MRDSKIHLWKANTENIILTQYTESYFSKSPEAFMRENMAELGWNIWTSQKVKTLSSTYDERPQLNSVFIII